MTENDKTYETCSGNVWTEKCEKDDCERCAKALMILAMAGCEPAR